MTSAEQHAVICNAGPDSLYIWVEPWCDELDLPPKSWLSYESRCDNEVIGTPPEIDMDDEGLVIWATGPGTALISIDGVVQDTASRTVDLPQGMFGMPVKSFVNSVFGEFPEARPGGRFKLAKQSLWQKIAGYFR